MFTRLLYLPFILGAGIALILSFAYGQTYAKFIVPNVIALAVIYMLAPQIDWWYYKKHPKQLDEGAEKLLRARFSYYANLSEELKVHFRHRLAMYLQAIEFIPKPWKTVPEDIKVIIAASIIQLTFGVDDYRLKSYERIVVYPKAFPSPQFPKYYHASEIHVEDNVILFSAEQLMWIILKPEKSYNIALHEFAKAFMDSYPRFEYPKFEESIWESLQIISGQKKAFVSDFIGLPEIDPVPVSITYFFTYPEKFKEVLPGIFEKYKSIFNQNPIQKEHPVIDSVDYTQF